MILVFQGTIDNGAGCRYDFGNRKRNLAVSR